MSLIKVAFFLVLGVSVVSAFDCAFVNQTACKDGSKFYTCPASLIAAELPCPLGTTCRDLESGIAACLASDCASDFPNGAYKCDLDTQPSLSFTQCSNGATFDFAVPKGTKCTQFNDTAIELAYNLPTDCNGRPNGDQQCSASRLSFTVCSYGQILQFDTPLGINRRPTRCVPGTAGNVSFVDDFESCGNGVAVGDKRCNSTDLQTFYVCTSNGWVQFSTPRGTQCQNLGSNDVTFLSNLSPCSPVGAEQCTEDNEFTYWTCTEYGLETNRSVAKDTKCKNFNDTAIILVWAFSEVPCEEGEAIGDAVCSPDGSTYTECTVLGRKERPSPLGAFCVQNETGIYFEIVTNTRCGAVATQRCAEDEASFDTCTWSGWENQRLAKGTRCSYGENGGLTIELSEEVEEQLAQLATLLGTAKNAAFGLLPSFLVLAVAALALAF